MALAPPHAEPVCSALIDPAERPKRPLDCDIVAPEGEACGHRTRITSLGDVLESHPRDESPALDGPIADLQTAPVGHLIVVEAHGGCVAEVEETELLYPLHIDFNEIETDSMGSGQWIGGAGTRTNPTLSSECTCRSTTQSGLHFRVSSQ